MGSTTQTPGTSRWRLQEVANMLLIALLLILLFGGLGFAAHILWLGLVLGLIVAVAHVVTGSTRV
jgi:hypothetical protein